MSVIIVDRTKSSKKKSSVNRNKFVKRVNEAVKKAVKDAISNSDIKSITQGKGVRVKVPSKDINEPNFHHGDKGISERVYPGNKNFNTGDRVKRPEDSDGGSGGSKGSRDGEGEDSFIFTLSQEEFLNYFFDDLELPDMIKKSLTSVTQTVIKRSGFTNHGTPNRLHIIRSLKKSLTRRAALRKPKQRSLEELQNQLQNLLMELSAEPDNQKIKKKISQIEKDIEVLNKKIKKVPFIDEIDLRYTNFTKQPIPITQAVMFAVMDVSGSMDEWHKTLAKKFFSLLYLFLTKSYDKIDIVFIRHHTTAKEVTEEEFFYAKETGGTIMSSAFDLMYQIMQERYPTTQWNAYLCQASDGDNWFDDNNTTIDILDKKILPLLQYAAYIQIKKTKESDIWPFYEKLSDKHKKFNMRHISDASDIYPVFRGLFEKQKKV